MNHEQLLARGLAALDFDIPNGILDALAMYIDELEKWNPLYGLVNAEGEDLIIKHVLDSLAPWRVLAEALSDIDRGMVENARDISKAPPPEYAELPSSATTSARITDIGTGAGFPGIPLALAFPQQSFILIERLEKRVRFLENIAALLRLKNVDIRQTTFENERDPLQCVVFRALKPFGDRKLFRSIWKRLEPGGVLFAYKGKINHARLELSELSDDSVLNALSERARIVPVWVPFLDEERCVVVAQKAQ